MLQERSLGGERSLDLRGRAYGSFGEKMARLVDRIIAYAGYTGVAIGCVFLVVMAFLVFTNVLLRFFFGKPLVFAEEYAAYLLIAIVYLGFAYTARMEGHIRVDVVYRHFTKTVRDGLDVTTSILILVVVGVCFWYSLGLFLENIKTHAVAIGLLRTPLWVPQTVLVIGLPILGLELAARVVKKFTDLRKNIKMKRA